MHLSRKYCYNWNCCEWLDYRIAKKNTGGIKSIPACLVSSITDTTFTKPEGFRSEKEKVDGRD